MEPLHLAFAWGWLLAGLLSGTILGLFFHDESWLGGYGSWRRRMLRLGHVAFFGTGFINLAFLLSLEPAGLVETPRLPAIFLALGAVTMPPVCFLSAWRRGFRHCFFVPVLSLIVGTGDFVLRVL
jgi:hypothetical protein